MMKKHLFLFFLLQLSLWNVYSQNLAPAPEPAGAVPSARQLAWHDMEYYAFVHFNMNTFTDKEWGNGKETPSQFNPTALDCRQWARTCKEAGMKAIIITAKHHDGFCLWPSKYSEHSIKNSPWKNGKGDVLKDLSEACKEYGLKMGVYLSPWDQNSKVYGKPEYNDLFKKQLEEVLTSYGDIFEVWFDGAVGEEYIGKMVYDWPSFIGVVRKNQPNAVIFSDAGPDIRWCGTEMGFVNETNYCTLNRDQYYPGTPKYLDLRSGNLQGSNWVPAEVDVSIRPGWYYHAAEDALVKSPEKLEQIYYESVGRGGNLLLNLPVDRRGIVHENDAASLKGLKAKLDATFSKNLITGATITATSLRGFDTKYAPANLLDGDKKTFYAAKDGVTTTTLELKLPQSTTFNVLHLAEYLPLGQRISAVKVMTFRNDHWEIIGQATTVGSKRLILLSPTTTDVLKIQIDGIASPTLAEIGLYNRKG
jgi:alpha-L-fucosidase